MGLIQSYNQWLETRHQNHIANMQSQGKCPDCNGRGFTVYPYNEFAYYSSFECPGCQGSGLFSAWEQMQ
ncbi:MAG TPA: methionine aminopeptidase [Bacillales bacterium]|nr:methionine aminopeptidase [Bacillales bacterium]